jgi:hypothetical protein
MTEKFGSPVGCVFFEFEIERIRIAFERLDDFSVIFSRRAVFYVGFTNNKSIAIRHEAV